MSKKCTPLWREAHVEVKMYKTHQHRTTFGSCDVEKVHAAVARSTFPGQTVKNTRGSDHFWSLRCRFAWQAQGILHLVKSEQNVRVLKHFQLQPPLHHTTLQYITLHYSYNYTFTTFYYTPLHSTYTQLHYTTLHYTTVHSTTLHYNYNYTTLHSTTRSLHYITLHSTTLQLQLHNYTKLHYTTLNYTTLHYITRHYLPLHYTT